MRELLSIELDQVSVPFLSELPNDGARDLHLPTKPKSYDSIFISEDSLPLCN